MSSTEKISIEQKLCLYFIFKNPIAFRDFFIPKAWEKVFYSYYYQYAPALIKELVWAGARGTGKSLDLEFSILQRPFGNPSEETLLTAFRKSHIKDRLEKVISYYAAVPYLRRFLKGDTSVSLREAVTRSPVYSIRFKNNHEISGISVGEDPAAIAIQGRHPKFRYLEEGHSYTKDAWLKFQNTQASTGSLDRFYGIPNGIVDTPFYEILHRLKKFKNKKFRVHKALEPNWTQETKREKLSTLKGPNSNDWLQEIEARDGEPSFGVWNEADLRKNIDFSESTETPGALEHQTLTLAITAKDYEGLDPNQALHNLPALPEPCDMILGIDAGYSQPTIILPFFFYKNKWCLRCKILLLDRMISDDQTELIDYVASFYNAFLGIDCSSADGRDIATKLCNPKNEQYANKQYDKRVAFIDFREALIVGYKKVKKGETEVLEEVKENMKNKSTSILRDKFSNSEFDLYYDEELIPEFISETQKNEGGRISINTPSTVHIPEAFRCFAGAFFKLRMTIEMPELEEGEDSEEYSFEYPKYEPDNLGLFGREKVDKSEENSV